MKVVGLIKILFLDYQTVNMLYLQNFRQLWYDVFVRDLIKLVQVKTMFGKCSLSNINQELFSEGSSCHSNQITFIGLVSSENYYRRPRIITPIAKGGIRQGGTNMGGSIGGRVRGELLGRGTSIVRPVEI